VERNWKTDIVDPVKGRKEKPRKTGMTMVLDKGLGLNELHDILQMGGEYIDFIKFSFGTSFVCPMEIVKKKIEVIKDNDIKVFPGGTLFEVAVTQNKINEYLFKAKQLGFNAMEISDGSITYDGDLRKEVIEKARDLGFMVLTEVGKKDKSESLSTQNMIHQLKSDIKNGADMVIIEARESGKNISIYKEDGSINIGKFDELFKGIKKWEDSILWEAPLKKQQVFMIKKIGPNVNLGNINAREVISLETLRRGLRGDTFKLEGGFEKESTYLIG